MILAQVEVPGLLLPAGDFTRGSSRTAHATTYSGVGATIILLSPRSFSSTILPGRAHGAAIGLGATSGNLISHQTSGYPFDPLRFGAAIPACLAHNTSILD